MNYATNTHPVGSRLVRSRKQKDDVSTFAQRGILHIYIYIYVSMVSNVVDAYACASFAISLARERAKAADQCNWVSPHKHTHAHITSHMLYANKRYMMYIF